MEVYLITIRKYKDSDAEILWSLFFHTVRNINARDYSQKQVEAWASSLVDHEAWRRRINNLSPFIAEIDGVIVGYADLQTSGLIDHFFCHHQYQRCGVGRALMNHILLVGKEQKLKRYYAHVSITARPFFESFGFHVATAQEVDIGGEKLKNFVMEKLVDGV